MREALILITLCITTSVASAQRLVVDSHTSANAREVELITAPVRSVLTKRGHLTSPRLAGKIGAYLPQPHRRPSKERVRRLLSKMNEGFEHWKNVGFEEAIVSLSAAVANVHKDPLLVTEDGKLRQKLFETYVLLALANKRRGNMKAAHDIMRQLLQSFPTRTISVARFSPEPRQLRAETLARMKKLGESTLVIETKGGGNAKLFVNERFVGQGPRLKLKVFPGQYRVFAKTEVGVSKLRVVTIAPKTKTTIRVDPAFDSTVRLQPHVAFAFTNGADQERSEVSYAMALSRLVRGAHGVIVLSVRKVRGDVVLVGRVITATGTAIRRGVVRITEDLPVSRLYALAEYLAGATRSFVKLRRPVNVNRRGFRFAGWRWAAFSVGIVAIPVGVYLLGLHEQGICKLVPPATQCQFVYDTRSLGGASLTVGGLGVLGGIAALIYDIRAGRNRQRQTKRRVSIVPALDGFMLVGKGRF